MEKEEEYARRLLEAAQSLSGLTLQQLENMTHDAELLDSAEERSVQFSILGGEYLERGKFAEADRFLKKAFKLFKEATGADNIAILLRLICLYQQEGSLVLASKFLNKALQLTKERPTVESIVMNCHIGMLTNHQLAGELDLANAYCTELFEQHGGSLALKAKNPLLYCLLLVAQGSICLQRSQFTRAQRKLLEALKTHESKGLEVTDHTSQNYLLLVRAYRLANQLPQAEEMALKGVEVVKGKLGSESWEVGLVYLALAEIKQARELWHEAVSYYKRTLRIYRRVCGKAHPNVATIYFQLGDVMAEMGRLEDSALYLKRSIAAIEKWEQSNDVKCEALLAETHYSLYWVYLLWQKLPEARHHLSKSVEILSAEGQESSGAGPAQHGAGSPSSPGRGRRAEGASPFQSDWQGMQTMVLDNLTAELRDLDRLHAQLPPVPSPSAPPSVTPKTVSGFKGCGRVPKKIFGADHRTPLY